MTDRQLLKQAIDESLRSSESIKCGVVIAKNGEIVTKTHNQQHSSHNATAHAEILAIGEAGRTLQNKNLYDCTMYCSCEPCTMCLSAIVFAKIARLVFYQKLSDLSPINKRINFTLDDFLSQAPNRPEVVQLEP